MQRSPIEFERFFREVMVAVDQAPSPDVGLVILTHLWDELRPHLGDSRYASYFEEYVGRLDVFISRDNLRDFTIEDHARMREAVQGLAANQYLSEIASIDKHLTQLAISEARLWANVGEVERAVELLDRFVLVTPVSNLVIPDSSISISEIRRLELSIPRVEPSAPQVAKVLADILADWQTESSALSHDRAWCLLVQSGPYIGGPWGRMLPLCGTVDLLKRNGKQQNGSFSDQVTFAHQLKAADDPAIGGVYDSLIAVRKLLTDLNLAGSACQRAWSVRLEFDGGTPLLHGDSLGLAAGLVTYAGLLKEEVLRHERKLSGEVGFTGGLDADGHLTPVSDSTLRQKVTRAFWSHLKYLAIPKENAVQAQSVIEELTARHPRRKLHLVPAESIADVVENHNLVRPEKLCPGAYVWKGARRYSKATKVQVPLLAALVLLLGFIIADQYLPECSKPWGDCNAKFVVLRERGFDAFNKDSALIWSIKGDCPTEATCDSCVIVIDIGVGSMVLYQPMFAQNQSCSMRNFLVAYTRSGHQEFAVPVVKLGEYPGDTTIESPYYIQEMRLLPSSNESIIMTEVTASEPARLHVRFWSQNGDSIGWYINQGFGGAGSSFAALSQDTVGLLAYNNRLKQTVLVILKAMGSEGVSPPYDNPDVPLPNAKRGNQLAYILLPSTELNWRSDMLTSFPYRLVRTGSGALRAEVYQFRVGHSEWRDELIFSLDHRFRVSAVTASDDFIIARDSFVKAGLIPPHDPLTENPYRLVDSVRYWTDSGWVTEGALRAAGQ